MLGPWKKIYDQPTLYIKKWRHYFADKSPSRRKLSAEELMLLNCGAGKDSSESLGLQGDQTTHS